MLGWLQRPGHQRWWCEWAHLLEIWNFRSTGEIDFCWWSLSLQFECRRAGCAQMDPGVISCVNPTLNQQCVASCIGPAHWLLPGPTQPWTAGVYRQLVVVHCGQVLGWHNHDLHKILHGQLSLLLRHCSLVSPCTDGLKWWQMDSSLDNY